MLATLVLGDLVTSSCALSANRQFSPSEAGRQEGDLHVVLQLLEVILLLLDLLAESEELLLLGLADEHFLLGALASLKGVTGDGIEG